jgi:hypothetical protein
MPPDDQDQRDHQLEVLRRYVAELSTTRQRDDDAPPPPTAPAEDWRLPGGPVLLAVLVLVSAALLGGFLIGRSSVPDPAPRAAAGAPDLDGGATADPAPAECRAALEQADRSLAHAARVSSSLAEQTRIMTDLATGRIDADTAVRTGMPSLVRGAAESSRFDVALAAYRQVAERCDRQRR